MPRQADSAPVAIACQYPGNAEWKCPRDAGRSEILSENETWSVDDWARIDVRISRVGTCSFDNSGDFV
ncbi:MAG: hypothetical protein ACKO70_08550 [Actinomycetota bacterium]